MAGVSCILTTAGMTDTSNFGEDDTSEDVLVDPSKYVLGDLPEAGLADPSEARLADPSKDVFSDTPATLVFILKTRPLAWPAATSRYGYIVPFCCQIYHTFYQREILYIIQFLNISLKR